MFGVSSLPELNWKTGEFGLTEILLESRRVFRADTGQHPCPLNSKTSMKSPCGFLLLGIFMCTRTEFLRKTKSFHNKVSNGLKLKLDGERTSPILNEPKNRRRQQDQKTWTESADQSQVARA
jgi:hypothetical protein